MKNILEFSGGKRPENGPLAEKMTRQKQKRTRQKNKTGDRKEESNGNPKIPDRGQTSDISGLPLGGHQNRGYTGLKSAQVLKPSFEGRERRAVRESKR